jgi:hypothetical protein
VSTRWTTTCGNPTGSSIPRGRCGVGRGLSAGFAGGWSVGSDGPLFALDMLRWFRFLYVFEIGWDRATRVQARDFCRWLQIGQAGAPALAPRRRADGDRRSARCGPRARPYAASCARTVRRVLRGFYDFHLDAGTGPIFNPFPPDRSGEVHVRMRTATRWIHHATSGPGCIGRRCRAGCCAASRTRSSPTSSPGWAARGPGVGGVLRLYKIT